MVSVACALISLFRSLFHKPSSAKTEALAWTVENGSDAQLPRGMCIPESA